jgi:hypothetical protein
MTEPPTEPFSLTPIFDQLLREQEQHPTWPDTPPDDTGPDQPAEDAADSRPSPPPS